MKTGSICAIVLVLILGVLSAREFLIREEIKASRVELESSLLRSLKDAKSLDRLVEIQESTRLYPSILEPVFTLSTRLLFPGASERLIRNWEHQVHQILENQGYSRALELKEETQAAIQKLVTDESPSLARLVRIQELAQGLDSGLDRLRLINEESKRITEANTAADQENLMEIKKLGKNSLSRIRRQQKNLSNKDFTGYLKSEKFLKEIEEPVMNKILELRHPQLRKDTWKEYSSERQRLLQKTKKAPTLVGELEENKKDQVQSIAELLKREYEIDVEFEKRSRERGPAIIPSNPMTSSGPEKNSDLKVFE